MERWNGIIFPAQGCYLCLPVGELCCDSTAAYRSRLPCAGALCTHWQAPCTMDNYEIVAQIGRGSYGKVYTVRDCLAREA